jgi:hypothetical protein
MRVLFRYCERVANVMGEYAHEQTPLMLLDIKLCQWLHDIRPALGYRLSKELVLVNSQ